MRLGIEERQLILNENKSKPETTGCQKNTALRLDMTDKPQDAGVIKRLSIEV